MVSWWVQQQRFLDNLVDQFWGEPVELHPMTPGTVGTDPAADSARPIMHATAVMMQPGAEIVGEAGRAYAYGGSNLRTIEQDVWVSIQDLQSGDITQWKPHDRVFWPDRGEWYEIAWINPSATHRADVHLIRVQDADV